MSEPLVLVMGVSGSGKSTLAQALAERTGWPFVDADDLHPPANVAKMESGIPLTDADRWPWLARVAQWLADRRREHSPAIVACSALKRAYRDLLREAVRDARPGSESLPLSATEFESPPLSATGPGRSPAGAAAGSPDLRLIYLRGEADALAYRLAHRHGHFFPGALLEAQLSDLQEPDPDERAIVVPIGQSIDVATEQVLSALQPLPTAPPPGG